LRDACITIFAAVPLNVPSTSTGTSAASQSWVSCGVAWKPQASLPVSGLTATMLTVHRLSPGRASPFSTGVGFPVPTYTRLSSGSYVPVIHICPPIASPFLYVFGSPVV
jgi:hypothetical protein